MAKQREDVARVQHLIALAAGARDGHQVVVADEHAQVGRAAESLVDPRIMLSPDLALVEIGLRCVHGHERNLGSAKGQAPA